MDLRPYGLVPPPRRNGPIVTYDDPTLAMARAHYKLQQWLDGRNADQSVGAAVWWPSLVMVCGFAELAFGAAYLWTMDTPAPLLLSGPLGIYLLIYGSRTIARSRARTPVDCVREFVHCVQRADLHRAWALVAPVDRDSYTRAAPSVAENDPVTVKRFAFDSRASFAAYWRAARALGPATRLRLVAGQRVEHLGPGIAVVSIEVNVQKTMRLQSEARTLDIRKLVLRHGNEWRVFDGEVASAAELDPQWLRQALAARLQRAPLPAVAE
jgi:hypothetical protein